MGGSPFPNERCNFFAALLSEPQLHRLIVQLVLALGFSALTPPQKAVLSA
jgi:hypothetical protein